MSVSSVTRSRGDFAKHLDDPSGKNDKILVNTLMPVIGKSPAQAGARLFEYVQKLSLPEKLSPEGKAAYEALTNSRDMLYAENPPVITYHGENLCKLSLDCIRYLQEFLDGANTELNPRDDVRIHGAILAFTRGLMELLQKEPNGSLAVETHLSPETLATNVKALEGKLAVKKLACHGVQAEKVDEDGAKKALKQGIPVYGFYVDPKTGQYIYCALELKNRIFGVGGALSPKQPADGATPWMRTEAFAGKITGKTEDTARVTPMEDLKYRQWTDLPERIQTKATAADINDEEKNEEKLVKFLQALNEKLQAYKKEHESENKPDETLKTEFEADDGQIQAVIDAVNAPPPPA
jgi:hypothetical protein